MRKLTLLTILALFASTIFFADNSMAVTEKQILGKWKIVKITRNKNGKTKNIEQDDPIYFAKNKVVNFQNNNLVTLDVTKKLQLKGKWSVTKDKLSLNLLSGGALTGGNNKQESLTIEQFSRTNMRIRQGQDNVRIYLKRL